VTRSDFRFADRLRVRWAEVDAQRIVFNGHYLMYLDTAMGAYWRALALPYEASIASLGGDLFLRKAALEYDAPARYDEVLEVALRFEGVGTSSMRFSAGVFRADERLAGGELLYVWTDAATRVPQRVPAVLVDAMRAYEAGEPMVRVEVGAWSDLGERAQPIRTAVFVEEQKIPAELEYDVADAEAVHAVAVNRLGHVLATGRLLAAEEPRTGRIGRMAVHRALRGSGVGRQVLEALADAARARGDTAVMLHAQQSAIGFYLRAGFQPRGEAFVEAGIPHQEMIRVV
jgi:YbgC/YbaW family acyl-CoA thioester hydrolase